MCRHFRAFDEELDGIVYASAIAVGFATYETLHLHDQLDGFEVQARALAAPLVHAVFASIWGWAFARARHHGRSPIVPTAIAFVIAALLHGAYDFLALSPAASASSALVVLGVWIWRIRLVHRLHAEAVTARIALGG